MAECALFDLQGISTFSALLNACIYQLQPLIRPQEITGSDTHAQRGALKGRQP